MIIKFIKSEAFIESHPQFESEPSEITLDTDQAQLTYESLHVGEDQEMIAAWDGWVQGWVYTPEDGPEYHFSDVQIKEEYE